MEARRLDPKLSLERILARVDELAVLPHVVFKVLELSADTDSSANAIEKVISVDPGFTSKVLKLANSAAFALPRPVTSISDAVMFLGMKTVRNLAMTAGVFDMFIGKTDKESLRRRVWWRHSIDAAVVAKWFSKEYRTVSPEEAYAASLLHNIGRTLLDKAGGQDYDIVMQLVEKGYDPGDAERALYGVDHVDLQVAAAEKWGFPPALLAGISYTQPLEGDLAKNGATTAIASYIALINMQGKSPDQMPLWAFQVAGLEGKAIMECVDAGLAYLATTQVSM